MSLVSNDPNRRPTSLERIETTAKVVAAVGFPSALLAGAFISSDSIEDFGKLVAQIGLPSACTILVFWFGINHMTRTNEQSTKREERMASRIDSLEDRARLLEDKFRNELVDLIKSQTMALTQNTSAYHDLKETIAEQHQITSKQQDSVIQIVTALAQKQLDS